MSALDDLQPRWPRCGVWTVRGGPGVVRQCLCSAPFTRDEHSVCLSHKTAEKVAFSECGRTAAARPVRETAMARALPAAVCLCAALMPASASAQMTDEQLQAKACIFAAADKLPHIAGLRIIRSSAQPATSDRAQQERRSDTLTEHYVVSIDVEAAAQSATFEYDCTTGPTGMTANPLGMKR